MHPPPSLPGLTSANPFGAAAFLRSHPEAQSIGGGGGGVGGFVFRPRSIDKCRLIAKNYYNVHRHIAAAAHTEPPLNAISIFISIESVSQYTTSWCVCL